MKITLISLNVSWENKAENFSKIEGLVESLKEKGELIILPEMFSTGFTMNTSLAESWNGETLRWMKELSGRNRVALVGSFPFCENGKYFNRAFFILPSGESYFYDKRHLFRMGGENEVYTCGDIMPIISYNEVNLGLNVCYDIRFPVWSRNVDLKYDVLINIANFPKQRVQVVDSLVKARAIENCSYVLFVNRDGVDVNLEYSKSSMFIDFKGNEVGNEVLIEDKCGNITQVICGEIDIQRLKEFRENFLTWLDNDNFSLK